MKQNQKQIKTNKEKNNRNSNRNRNRKIIPQEFINNYQLLVRKIVNKYSYFDEQLKQDCYSIANQTLLKIIEKLKLKQIQPSTNSTNPDPYFNYIYTAITNNVIHFIRSTQKNPPSIPLNNDNNNQNNNSDNNDNATNNANIEKLSYEIANTPSRFSNYLLSDFAISSIQDPLKLIEKEEKRQIIRKIIVHNLQFFTKKQREKILFFLQLEEEIKQDNTDNNTTNHNQNQKNTFEIQKNNNNNSKPVLDHELKRKLAKLLTPVQHLIM